LIEYTGAALNDADHWFLRGADTSAARFMMMANGGLHNYTANDVNLSDARSKNIRGVPPPQRALFRQLQLVEAQYKDAPTTPYDVMLTAQNVQAVYPDLVTEFEPGVLGVKEHGIVMRALRVIQEQDAELEALKARVLKLERP